MLSLQYHQKEKELKMELKNMFKDIKSDLPASIVVFFVALPLCLGIALASGAPLFSGIIAGIIGGIIVGMASGSALGVSGPAAGLAVIVLTSIATLGSWPAFLLAVVLAGVIQLAMGFAKAGFIAYFFPSSVIKGMLTGIGLLIILKQIPHALGYDKDTEGDDAFFQADGENTFSALASAFEWITPGAILIASISIAILILWDTVLTKKHKIFQLIQGPIVVVILGIVMNYLFQNGILNFSLASDQVVQLPVAKNFSQFLTQFTFPDFTQLTNPEIYKIALVMAIVASLETLLCVEATDKIDPFKRVTPTNRELKAQGLGNILSGMIGGLPITQVIVRSSANISFGGKTKIDSIIMSIRFEDGDGDLGITAAEIKANPKYKDFRNFEVDVLLKKNVQYVPVLFSPKIGGLINFQLRPDQKPGPIEGSISYSTQFVYAFYKGYSPLFTEFNDTLKFQIYIKDKEFHQSNTVETDPVIIFQK